MCEETSGGAGPPQKGWPHDWSELFVEALRTRGVSRLWVAVCLVLGLGGVIGVAAVGGAPYAYGAVIVLVVLMLLAGRRTRSGCDDCDS